MPTVSAGQRYNFLDIPTLRAPYIFLQGIEAYCVDQVTKSPNNNTPVTATGAKGIVLTLSIRETEEIYQLPLWSLIASQNGGLIREFNNKQVNLTKSYITILDATNVAANECVLFNFYYQRGQ